ncbi:MAG: glycosyltransferase family 2 protein [Bacteroidetes bacterium]|nr:glycosyltransferase family 2 protein [Bacteroidota bacterium]
MKYTPSHIQKPTQELISIITVNYNQAKVTCELLKSLSRISYLAIEIIVVDNASSEGTEMISDQFPGIKLVCSNKNLGFAGGNNLGLKEAQGKYILFINNDVEVSPDFLEPLVARLSHLDTTAAVSPKIKYFTPGTTIQYAGSYAVNPFTLRNTHIGTGETDYGQYNEPRLTSYAHGACMLVKKSVIDLIGSMDECFFLYYEEQDWCERMNRHGYHIFYVPQSEVFHKESMSTGKNSPLKTYYLSRNRILFARKNFKGLQFLISMLYLICISIPKNIISLSKEKEKLSAYFAGIVWNVTHKKSYH